MSKDDLPKALQAILKVAGKVYDEFTPMAGHGAAEIMSAAYTGNAFVVYGHADPEANQTKAAEQPQHGLGEPQAEQQQGMGY